MQCVHTHRVSMPCVNCALQTFGQPANILTAGQPAFSCVCCLVELRREVTTCAAVRSSLLTGSTAAEADLLVVAFSKAVVRTLNICSESPEHWTVSKALPA